VSTFHADNAAKDVDVRLKDGVTTVYIGSCYDKEGNTTRTYYYHNG
jgi:hypothetical protein